MTYAFWCPVCNSKQIITKKLIATEEGSENRFHCFDDWELARIIDKSGTVQLTGPTYDELVAFLKEKDA